MSEGTILCMKCKLNVAALTDFLHVYTHCHAHYKDTQNILKPYVISVDVLHT
jgi:hypothetical protein